MDRKGGGGMRYDEDVMALANGIQRELLDQGFRIHRYDAFSTPSVYLMLDGGLCGKVRVSDHKGAPADWNIGRNVKAVRCDGCGLEKAWFYPPDAKKRMYRAIRHLRDRRVAEAGSPEEYARAVEEELERRRRCPRGFWRGCWEARR